MSILSMVLATLTGILVVIAGSSAFVALRSGREARATLFPIVREEETKKARRARGVTVLTSILSTVLAAAWVLSNHPDLEGLYRQQIAQLMASAPEKVAVTEEPLPATEEKVVANATLVPTFTPTAMPSPSPTESGAEVVDTPQPPTDTPLPPTPTPTHTTTSAPPTTAPVPPTETPPPTTTSDGVGGPLTPNAEASITQEPEPTPTPQGTPVPAPPGAELGPVEFAKDVAEGPIRAVDPADSFVVDDIGKLYAVYPYRNMVNGTPFKAQWYYNGSPLLSDERTWQWGKGGSSYVFIRPTREGEYKLELYVGDELLASGTCTILATATPTEEAGEGEGETEPEPSPSPETVQ